MPNTLAIAFRTREEAAEIAGSIITQDSALVTIAKAQEAQPTKFPARNQPVQNVYYFWPSGAKQTTPLA